MGAPLGNQNAAHRNVIRQAFKTYASENPNDLRALVVKLYVEALNGNIQAAALIFDRTEGKASQPLTGGDEGDEPIKFERVIRLVKGADVS